MYRLTAYLTLLLSCFAPYLSASGRHSLRGEIIAEGDIRLQDLAVELKVDNEPHAERIYLTPSGAFEFRNIASGLHRLRVVTVHGETLREEFVHVGNDLAPVIIRLRGAAPGRPGGVISARRLAFKPSKLAKKEWREAEKCIRRGDHAEAAQHLREAVEADPNYFEAHLHLGTALLMSGDAAGALAAYEKALEIDPDSAYALVHRGILLLHFRRAAEAEQCATKAVRLEETPSGHYVLGMSLAAQGKQLGDALEHLKLAAVRHPQAARIAAQIEAHLKAHQ